MSFLNRFTCRRICFPVSPFMWLETSDGELRLGLYLVDGFIGTDADGRLSSKNGIGSF